MADKITLNTGIKRVPVETTDGNTHVLVFNPNDVIFVEKLHKLYRDGQEKVTEIEKYVEEAEDPVLDDSGVPVDISEITEKTKEINAWIRGEIDNLLGDGTCHAIFGDVNYYGESFGVYVQLITQLNSFVEPFRAAKVKKYIRE